MVITEYDYRISLRSDDSTNRIIIKTKPELDVVLKAVLSLLNKMGDKRDEIIVSRNKLKMMLIYLSRVASIDDTFDLDDEIKKLTKEDLSEELPKETIQIKLSKIVQNDNACMKLDINPWCVNEGVDRESWVEVELVDAKNWGLV